MCQLDVDHIDGDSSNNDPSNYMTLCANCHRRKTMIEGDHLSVVGFKAVSKGHGGVRPGAGGPPGEWFPDKELLKLVKS